MILILELDLDNISANQHAKYLDQRLCIAQKLSFTLTHPHLINGSIWTTEVVGNKCVYTTLLREKTALRSSELSHDRALRNAHVLYQCIRPSDRKSIRSVNRNKPSSAVCGQSERSAHLCGSVIKRAVHYTQQSSLKCKSSCMQRFMMSAMRHVVYHVLFVLCRQQSSGTDRSACTHNSLDDFISQMTPPEITHFGVCTRYIMRMAPSLI